MVELTRAQALSLRMTSLLLGPSPGGAGRPTGVAEVVTWLGAMQAQDLASGQWSLGVRLPGSTVAGITAALERRGYKQRSLMLADEHKEAIVPGGNGMFLATVVCDDRVVGTWKRTLTKTWVQIAVRPLVPLGRADRTRVERAFEGYGRFVERAPEVHWR